MSSGPIDKTMHDQISRWRLKAEELRATADHLQNPRAQESFRRMAETYERLVDDFSRRFAEPERGDPAYFGRRDVG